MEIFVVGPPLYYKGWVLRWFQGFWMIYPRYDSKEISQEGYEDFFDAVEAINRKVNSEKCR